MGLMTKLKTQIDLWKLEKYTKRRHVATPDFEQKGNMSLLLLLCHKEWSRLGWCGGVGGHY